MTGRNRDWWRLTDREHAILQLAADGFDGFDGPAAARELGIAVQTVKFHRTGIFQKLGAKNMPHAVALAYHRGILLIPSTPDPVVTVNGAEYRRTL